MEIGDWITLGAIIVALGIGVASILHTQSLQKKERKERLLNEIIEWALELSTCKFSIPAPMMLEDIIAGSEKATVDRMVERARLITFTNIRLKYQIADRKSKYFEDIAFSLSGYLGIEVNKLREKLQKVIRALRECSKDFKNRSKEEYLAKVEDSLVKQANILVKKAIDTKTKDIN